MFTESKKSWWFCAGNPDRNNLSCICRGVKTSLGAVAANIERIASVSFGIGKRDRSGGFLALLARALSAGSSDLPAHLYRLRPGSWVKISAAPLLTKRASTWWIVAIGFCCLSNMPRFTSSFRTSVAVKTRLGSVFKTARTASVIPASGPNHRLGWLTRGANPRMPCSSAEISFSMAAFC